MQNHVVVITGASRGIGAAAARVFVAAGARVGLVSQNAAALTDLAAELGPAALALPADVADWGQVSAAVDRVRDHWGRLDAVIANAGMIEPMVPLATADPDLWRRAVEVNLLGVFHLFRAALPAMRAQGAGTLIAVSSGAAHQPLEGWSAYCASKAAAAMLVRQAHLEEAVHGLRVMGLSPGTVATDMQRRIKASGIGPVARLDPSVHIPAEWPARALAWMCGPDAAAHAGQELSLRDDWLRRAAGLI
jgi:NAD(P)-dependent dehydrogenase (short-subunit alcohol dehydrogenase family)